MTDISSVEAALEHMGNPANQDFRKQVSKASLFGVLDVDNLSLRQSVPRVAEEVVKVLDRDDGCLHLL